MDAKRFDSWTRNRALRLSRRDALRLAGAGGASFVLSPASAAAQASCTLTLQVETVAGPSAPTSLNGVLAFSPGSDGSLEQATFTPSGETSRPVTGAVTGRAIDFSIELGPSQSLSFSGVSDRPGPTCPTAMNGVLSGPQPGDLGSWQASGSTGSTAASASAPSTGSSCPSPQTRCGPNCCPRGATCTNTTQGLCSCPSGTVQCGVDCVQECPIGQRLDLDSCSCTSSCSPDAAGCASNDECCSGFCDGNSGACQTCQTLVCDGVGCVDPSFDPNNCGGCGIVCTAPKASCTDGACACQPDGLPCVKHYDCCSDSCDATGVCGCAPVGGDCSSFDTTCCGNGVDTICFSDTCRYFNTGNSCFSDNECITDVCSNGVCSGCIDPGGSCTRSAECCNYNGLGCVNGICPM